MWKRTEHFGCRFRDIENKIGLSAVLHIKIGLDLNLDLSFQQAWACMAVYV